MALGLQKTYASFIIHIQYMDVLMLVAIGLVVA